MHGAAAAAGHWYDAFGLTIRSALPLKGLAAATPGRCDVDMQWGHVRSAPGAPAGYRSLPGGTLLTIPEVGRYWIVSGSRITVDPAPGASERNVRLFLLGSALGAILHQRGLVPLHANAVAIDGRAVAFMGHSGAGKSTLAAWFMDRGHAVLTDDVCVVDPAAPAGPVAFRGLQRLRLWSEALAHTGRQAIEADRSFDDQDKFDVAVAGDRLAPASLPLGAAVLLERADDDRFDLRRLRGAEAVQTLFENVYRGGYADVTGIAGGLLQSCARLARGIPVLAVRRRWGLQHFDEEAANIAEAVGLALSPPAEIEGYTI